MNKKIKSQIKNNLRKCSDEFYIKTMYFLRFKRHLNLKNPKYFTEKIQWKKLYDRRPLLTTVADKVKVREYAKDKLNIDIMPKVLWVGNSPKDIPFEKLPNDFVIKTNHGSGTNIIVKDKTKINKESIIRQLDQWLNIDYYYLEKEWAYKNIEKLVFVEELLYDEKGEIPSDYKFLMFHGKVKAINLILDRFGNNKQDIYVDKSLKFFDDYSLYKNRNISTIIKPKVFNAMIDYAEKLSSDFDFIRVDFYDLGNQVILGELTNYPAAGFERLPKEFDEYLGSFWTLPIDIN